MMYGLPHSMCRQDLENFLDREGFVGSYDFIYLPTDLQLGGCFGYGFVNLVTPQEALRFQQHFADFQWSTPQEEPLGLRVSAALQGLDQLSERYRNSPLMHRSVPMRIRPAVYSRGVVAPFPPPTERLRAPRTRTEKKKPSAVAPCV